MKRPDALVKIERRRRTDREGVERQPDEETAIGRQRKMHAETDTGKRKKERQSKREERHRETKGRDTRTHGYG